MEKTCILFILGSLEGGGAEKTLITILQQIDFRKYTVDLCLIKAKGVYLDKVPEKVRIIPLYSNPNSLIARFERRVYQHFGISILHKIRIRGRIKKKYSSIISFLEGKPLKFHAFIKHRSNFNVSWIHTDLYNNHNTIGSTFSRKDEKKAYNQMDKLVFVSHDAKIQFLKTYDNLNGIHEVFYNPINRKEIVIQGKVESINKRKITICCVGSLKEVKGFDRVLRLARSLVEQRYDLDFWIIGEGPDLHSLEELRNSLNLQDVVHFLGFKNPPYPFMKSADIFLSTSKAEGFSLVLCEAMCLGIPVVATKCTGPLELLERNTYGILVDHDDSSILNGVKSLLDNESLRIQYGKQAKKRSRIFNLEESMNKFYNVINNSGNGKDESTLVY